MKHHILFLTVGASVLLCASVIIWLLSAGMLSFSNTEETAQGGEWVEYVHSGLPIYISRPSVMGVSEREDGAAFTLIGSTQAAQTELFDGISFNISLLPRPENDKTSLEDIAKAAMEDASQHGTITEELSKTTIANEDAYRFVLDGQGKFTNFILTPSSTFTAIVTYIAPDPSNKKYQATVDEMLGSLKFSQ